MLILAYVLAALAAVPEAARDTLPMRLADAGAALVAPETAGTLEPSGVAVDAFGRVFASDAHAHRLARFDPHGAWIAGEGTLGSDPGQFRRPGAVALHGTLEVIVLDRENRRIVRYDLLGQYLGVLVDLADPGLEQQAGRIEAVDLACDRGGALAVADRDGDRVLQFDASGGFIRALGGFGGTGGSFHDLAGLAYSARGELITAERTGARVQRLEPGGHAVGAWSLPGAAGAGALPVAAAADGRIAVGDERRGRVWLFDPGGRLLAMHDDFRAPRALAFAPDGTLLVAEGAGNQLRRLIARPALPDSARAE